MWPRCRIFRGVIYLALILLVQMILPTDEIWAEETNNSEGKIQIKQNDSLVSYAEKSRPEVVVENNKKTATTTPESELKTAVLMAPSPTLASVDIRIESAGARKKGWYKKWWAVALGVGLVAMVAIASGGGGSDNGGESGSGRLPDPPPPPKR